MTVIGIGEFEGPISCLSFSKADGGVYLCAIDEKTDHNISVWDWQKSERGTKVTETKVYANSAVFWKRIEQLEMSTFLRRSVRSIRSFAPNGILWKGTKSCPAAKDTCPFGPWTTGACSTNEWAYLKIGTSLGTWPAWPSTRMETLWLGTAMGTSSSGPEVVFFGTRNYFQNGRKVFQCEET